MSNRPNKKFQLENMPKIPELIIPKYSLDVSVLTVLGLSLSSVTPEQKRISHKNKSNETPDVSILRKYPILETVPTIKYLKGII